MSSLSDVPRTAANTPIMSESNSPVFGLSKMQDKEMLTLLWRSFLGYGNKGFTCPFKQNNVQYIHFVRMWLCSRLIAECVRLWTIDAPLTLTLHTASLSLYGQSLWSKHILELLTTNHSFLRIIFCILMFCRPLLSDSPLHAWHEREMTEPYHIPALLAGN